jgi:hypothetical protein
MSPSSKTTGSPWTQGDDDQLRTLAAAGESCSIIAELSKRSHSSIRKRGSHAQDQVGPFAARAEDEKHPEEDRGARRLKAKGK